MTKITSSKEHDPNILGWMEGFPPPHEKVIRFAEKSFYAWPQLRWSLSHIDELMPTKNVWRGSGPCRDLLYKLKSFDDARIKTLSGAESSSGFTLRDFVRFGELMRTGGTISGIEIISAEVIKKVMGCGTIWLGAKGAVHTA